MEIQFNSVFEGDAKLELIQIDCDGPNLDILRHSFRSSNLIETKRDFNRTREKLKKV
jgi:hypothetical protein